MLSYRTIPHPNTLCAPSVLMMGGVIKCSTKIIKTSFLYAKNEQRYEPVILRGQFGKQKHVEQVKETTRPTEECTPMNHYQEGNPNLVHLANHGEIQDQGHSVL